MRVCVGGNVELEAEDGRVMWKVMSWPGWLMRINFQSGSIGPAGVVQYHRLFGVHSSGGKQMLPATLPQTISS